VCGHELTGGYSDAHGRTVVIIAALAGWACNAVSSLAVYSRMLNVPLWWWLIGSVFSGVTGGSGMALAQLKVSHRISARVYAMGTQAYITDMEQLDRRVMFARIGMFQVSHSVGNVLGSLIIGKSGKDVPPLLMFAVLFAVWLIATVHTVHICENCVVHTHTLSSTYRQCTMQSQLCIYSHL
jgi:MFS family permease